VDTDLELRLYWIKLSKSVVNCRLEAMTVSSIQISSSLLAYSLLTPGWAFTKHFMKFKYLKRYFTTDGFELSDNFINGHPFFQDRNLVKVLCSDLNFDAWSNFVTGTGRDMGSFF